jgi:hypothetical protein
MVPASLISEACSCIAGPPRTTSVITQTTTTQVVGATVTITAPTSTVTSAITTSISTATFTLTVVPTALSDPNYLLLQSPVDTCYDPVPPSTTYDPASYTYPEVVAACDTLCTEGLCTSFSVVFNIPDNLWWCQTLYIPRLKQSDL